MHKENHFAKKYEFPCKNVDLPFTRHLLKHSTYEKNDVENVFPSPNHTSMVGNSFLKNEPLGIKMSGSIIMDHSI